MTREEAIEMLKALNMMLRSPDGKPISDACDALDMAIEALSAENSNAKTQNSNQETQKSNGDLIYREDAIEAIFKVGHEHVEEKVIPLGAVTDYSDAIKALPSAEGQADIVYSAEIVAEALSDAYNRGFEDAKRAYEVELARSAETSQDLAKPNKISRAELFNKLAVINAPMEANEYKAEVYRIINEL
jgi:hypothetical protein